MAKDLKAASFEAVEILLDDVKPATKQHLDKLCAVDSTVETATLEVDGKIVEVGEPKEPVLKEAKYWTDEKSEVALFEQADGRWSIVVLTDTGRAHTWGTKEAVLAVAKRLGIVV